MKRPSVAQVALLFAGLAGGVPLLAGLAEAPLAHSVFPGRNGKIVYVDSRGGDGEIFRMRPDGRHKEALTSNAADDESPSFSPNGRRIAFASNRDGNYEIYIMNADGSHQVRVTDDPADDDVPSFSPDGQRIVFFAQQAGSPSRLYIVRTDGTDRRLLTTKRAVAGPAWSPTGGEIAFSGVATRGGGVQIWFVKPDGTHLRQVTRNIGHARFVWNADPDFAPKGKRVVLQRQRDPQSRTRIWVMRADGSRLHLLTQGRKANTSSPVFSPSGTRIAYNLGFGGGISAMRADGSHNARLSDSGGGPSWGVRP